MTQDWIDDPSTTPWEKLTRFDKLLPVTTTGPPPIGHPLLIEALERGHFPLARRS